MDVIKWFRRIHIILWFSWQELSNWTKPYIFALYIMIRPLFGLLLYAYIYIAFAIASGLVDLNAAFYLISGIALYNFIGEGIYGVTWVIHEEREHYSILKYNYISFPNLRDYLLARSLVNYIIGFIISVIILIIGFHLVGLGFSYFNLNIPLLLLLYIIGFLWSSFLAITVSGTSLFSSEYGPLISEAIGGLLFLLGNVLFPVNILPNWLLPLAEALPMADWMELMRHALNLNYMVNLSHLLAKLLIKTLLYILIGLFFFALADKLARKKGLLEASFHH